MATSIMARYPKTAEHVYAQEEPRNGGAYLFIADQFRAALGVELRYVGRDASATPAVGSKRADKAQQEAVLTAAVGPKPKDDKASEKPADKSPPRAEKDAQVAQPARQDERITRATA